VTVDAVPDTNDAEVQVWTKKVVLFHLTAGPVQSARERGEESARVFSNMVGPDLKMYEVQIRKVGENPVLYLRTQRLVDALPSDAKRAGKSQAELADEWQAAVKNALWEQRINDIY